MTSIERLYSWLLIFAMSSSVSSETHCKASPFSSSLHSLAATSLRKKSMRWSFKGLQKIVLHLSSYNTKAILYT